MAKVKNFRELQAKMPAESQPRVASRVKETLAITTIAGNSPPPSYPVEVQGGFSGDGGPAIDAELSFPIDVTVDDSGNIYIADYNNNRIRKVSPDGVITTIAGNGASGYSGDGGPAIRASIARPMALAVDGAGNVYVADQGNNAIRILRPVAAQRRVARD